MLFRPVPTHPGHDAGPGLDPGQQAEDALLYRDTLHELIGIGTDLARLTHQQAIAQAQAAAQGAAPAAPLEGHTAAFDRTARAIRRCITLARSLHEPAAPARTPAPARAAAGTPAPHGAGGDAAGHPHPATPERGDAARCDSGAEAPGTDQRDRPDRDDTRDGPDRDEDDTGRPPAAVIADICRDLALAAPPGAELGSHHAPAGIEQLCAQAAARSAAATGTARQSGPEPRDRGPQAPSHGAPQPGPDLPPDNQQPGGPDQPAASPHAQPGPAHASTPPDNPAAGITARPWHPATAQEQWRPPPSG